MSSKEQKTPEGQAPEEIIMDQHEEIEAVEPEASAEQVDPRDEKIANLEAQLAEAQTRERDGILRVKAEMENLRRRTELDIVKNFLRIFRQCLTHGSRDLNWRTGSRLSNSLLCFVTDSFFVGHGNSETLGSHNAVIEEI
ncbi:hypothetical protein ACT4US_10675, partial [Bacillus sp. HC-Mk]